MMIVTQAITNLFCSPTDSFNGKDELKGITTGKEFGLRVTLLGEEDMEVEKFGGEEMKNINKGDRLVERTGTADELEGAELDPVERKALGVRSSDGLMEDETNNGARVKGQPHNRVGTDEEFNNRPRAGDESVGRTGAGNEAKGVNVESEGKREESKGDGESAGDVSAMDVTDVAVTGAAVPDSVSVRGKMRRKEIIAT